jgi:UDP-2-acetamido-3-amino-2,3-dideoxy-glucuronate N-acetyltransferase
MSHVWLRGERVPVAADQPVDLIVPEWNVFVTDTILGEGVVLWANVNVYGATIGPEVRLASFVEVHRGARIGARSKIQPFVVVPTGVTLGERVFIGPHVSFTNDLYPEACGPDGRPKDDFAVIETWVDDGASIGAGSVLIPGIRIGKEARIGAGSVVAEDVPAGEVWFGDKARRRSGPGGR